MLQVCSNQGGGRTQEQKYQGFKLYDLCKAGEHSPDGMQCVFAHKRPSPPPSYAGPKRSCSSYGMTMCLRRDVLGDVSEGCSWGGCWEHSVRACDAVQKHSLRSDSALKLPQNPKSSFYMSFTQTQTIKEFHILLLWWKSLDASLNFIK